MLVPLIDADGDPTAQTTPDTEISEDNAAATDAAEEVTATSGMDGMGLITFSGAETDCSTLAVNFKAASGPKATLATLYPRQLASIGTGTLSAGSAGGGTLGTLLAYDVTGCFVKTTGGTGGGGTGGANNQVRKIITYNTSTGAFTVEPNWETTPSTDTTYDVLLPEGVTLGMLRTLNPTTAGRTLTIESDGMAHADVKEWLGTAPLALSSQQVQAIVPNTQKVDVETIKTRAVSAAGAVVVGGFVGQDTAAIGVNASGHVSRVVLVDTATTLTNLPAITNNWLTAAGLATDAVEEIRNAITGGAYALSTDASGMMRIVDGTGTGEVNTSSGSVSVFDFTTAAKALLQTEAEDAIVAHRLDELLNADSDIDGAAPPTVGSVFHELMSKTAGSFTFDQTTDSLEALRDRGDAAWITATGFSTHSAADVWGVATRVLTAGTNIALAKGTGVTGFNDLSAADVRSALGLASANLDTQLDALPTANEVRNAVTGGAYALDTDANGRIRIVDGTGTGELDTLSGTVLLRSATQASIDAILVDTNELQTDWVNGGRLDLLIDAIKAKTDNLPASPAAVGSAMTLTSGERDSIASAHLDLAAGIETGVTVRQATRAVAAMLAGIIGGAGTGTEAFKGIGQASGGTTRVTVTVDSSGNRSAMSLNL